MIETERLILRPFIKEDATDVFSYYISHYIIYFILWFDYFNNYLITFNYSKVVIYILMVLLIKLWYNYIDLYYVNK